MKVLIVAETKDGSLRKASLELIAQAQALGASDITALLPGKGVAALATQLGQHGATRVLVAESDLLEHYTTEGYTHVVKQAVDSIQPDLVLFCASTNGKDLSPRLAARLDAGLASDVTEIKHNGSHFEAVRPIYAGKAMARVSIQSTPALISVRANAMKPSAADASRSAEVTPLDVQLSADQIRAKVVAVETAEAGKLDVAEADIIVSGGRGLKGPENFNLIEDLANVLGAATGASRAVVDAGWRPHGEQVGQTGKTVSPTLYVACAISGAMQHMAGMSSSKYIVAINTDAEAPIFKVASYGMVGDVFQILPELTEKLKAVKSH